MPGEQGDGAERELAPALQERERERELRLDAKRAAEEHIAALLHSGRRGDEERRRTGLQRRIQDTLESWRLCRK